MSIDTQITRITSLGNRLKTKLKSLGLLVDTDTDKLADCTAAVESIDERTPYSITTPGIKNVAGYKYAQIDTNSWQPATPSSYPDVSTYLGENGIEQLAPTHTQMLGYAFPPSGYAAIRSDRLFIDTDVVKAENIRERVSILGVTGNYNPLNKIYSLTGYSSNNSVVFEDVPFHSVLDVCYLSLSLSPATPISVGLTEYPIMCMWINPDYSFPQQGALPFTGWKTGKRTFVHYPFSFRFAANNNNGYDLTISGSAENYFAENTYTAPLYEMFLVLNE